MRREASHSSRAEGVLALNVNAIGASFPGAWRETHRYSERMDIARRLVHLRDGRSLRSAVRCIFQNLSRPLIETFPGRLSGDEHCAMDFRRHPEHEVSGGGLFWRNALGCAIFQIIIHCSGELGAQFGDRFSVKTDDGAHPKLDPRAFAFQDLAAECKDERLNIGKCDGRQPCLPV